MKCDLFVQIVYLVYTFQLNFSLFFPIIYYVPSHKSSLLLLTFFSSIRN